jgi:hypothetical protein
MDEEIKFELLKTDYIQKSEKLLQAVKSLQLDELRVIGTKGRIAALRHEAAESYFKLLECMVNIKIKIEVSHSLS